METSTLPTLQDPMGAAILDYQMYGKASNIRVLSSMFEEDVIPVSHLFRTYKEMSEIERYAIDMAQGSVLDIGAGAGCHSIALQERGVKVKAIDISPLGCRAMKCRGIKDIECINVFCPALQGKFDTLLLLMNGTGIAGKLSGLPQLLMRLKELMADNGQILIDSSDLKYIYENEDGTFDIDTEGSYYGEVDYQMIYKNVKGEPFDWLYADPTLLTSVSKQCGLDCEIIKAGKHYGYLARICKQKKTEA